MSKINCNTPTPMLALNLELWPHLIFHELSRSSFHVLHTCYIFTKSNQAFFWKQSIRAKKIPTWDSTCFTLIKVKLKFNNDSLLWWRMQSRTSISKEQLTCDQNLVLKSIKLQAKNMACLIMVKWGRALSANKKSPLH